MRPAMETIVAEKVDSTLKNSLNSETGTITWSELARHFARGVVVVVQPGVDLVEVATRIAENDAGAMENWLQQNKVSRATDDDARIWNVRDPLFWCVVTAPWVLVQEKESDQQIVPGNPTH